MLKSFANIHVSIVIKINGERFIKQLIDTRCILGSDSLLPMQGFFLKKMLGTWYGPIGTLFPDSSNPICFDSRDSNRVPKTP